MTVKTIQEGVGWSILKDDEPHTPVPYPPADHGDGNYSQGFILLADHPERAELIHEAQRSPGLMKLLKEVNRVGSPLSLATRRCSRLTAIGIDWKLRL